MGLNEPISASAVHLFMQMVGRIGNRTGRGQRKPSYIIVRSRARSILRWVFTSYSRVPGGMVATASS